MIEERNELVRMKMDRYRRMRIQPAMLVCRSPGEHTVLRSRDEHDGVCGLWLLLVDLGVILLIVVECFGESGCSGVCIGGDGDVVFPAKLSTPHVSAAARQSCGVVKPERDHAALR